MTRFARWLRVARETADLSQDQLAKLAKQADPRARIVQNRVSEWERSFCVPSLLHFNAVCSALKLSPAQKAKARELWDAAQLEDGDTLDQESSEESEPTQSSLEEATSP